MSEIMSAKELFCEIEQIMSDSHGYDAQEIENAIRSRDSAMIEKYKEATREAVERVYQSGVKQGKWLYLNTGPHDPRIQIQPDMDYIIDAALDSAFAEIEGGK